MLSEHQDVGRTSRLHHPLPPPTARRSDSLRARRASAPPASWPTSRRRPCAPRRSRIRSHLDRDGDGVACEWVGVIPRGGVRQARHPARVSRRRCRPSAAAPPRAFARGAPNGPCGSW
ncbi:excalibur calcium-binding domain-containing protein [Streptomyces katrae]|uniref:excalibur calcium-binding domain-containing protein n=1 Tax=Streptomyces katrae TaxID=68223 RepID=UPI002D21BB51|nr:excalibur calcium-binding domain-containing protein [Streptomyces katrae]